MILDVIVLLALLVSAIIAFLRGFIREVLTILGVVGGLAAAYFGGPILAPTVHKWFEPENADEPQKLMGMVPYDVVADAIAYGSIFIVVVIVLSVASHFLSGWARTIGLGAVDRILGVLFGIARGVVVLALLYLPVHVLIDEETRNSWFEGSKTHYYVAATSDWMAQFLPETVKEDATKKAEKSAEDIIKATRDKLQEMDVMQTDDPQPAQQPGGEEPKTQGYEEGQRDNLNELFEENTYDEE